MFKEVIMTAIWFFGLLGKQILIRVGWFLALPLGGGLAFGLAVRAYAGDEAGLAASLAMTACLTALVLRTWHKFNLPKLTLY